MNTCRNIALGAVLVNMLAWQMFSAQSAQAKQIASAAAIGGGTAARAYRSAHAHPEVFSKVFCYCGCDKERNHASLMDCYNSDHWVGCAICKSEALMVDNMIKQGKQTTQIQQAIDSSFSGSYPSPTPSPALLRYRASAGQ